MAAADQLLCLFHHKAGFVPFIRRIVIGNGSARRIFCPQFFRFAPRIVLNHSIGRVQNDSGRAVILLQLQQLRFGIIFFKIQNVADVRAPPAVDALVVVAHHA